MTKPVSNYPKTPEEIYALVEKARAEWAEVFSYQHDDPQDDGTLKKKRVSIRSKVFDLMNEHFEEIVLSCLGFKRSSWGSGLEIHEKSATYKAILEQVEQEAGPFFAKLLKQLNTQSPTEKMIAAANKVYASEFTDYVNERLKEVASEDAEKFLDQILTAERKRSRELLEATFGIEELAKDVESDDD
jgi:hypothetical protein